MSPEDTPSLENDPTTTDTERDRAQSPSGDADDGAAANGYVEDIEGDPQNAGRYIRHAHYLLKAGDMEEALTEAEKATKLEPQSVDAWACLARVQHLSALFRESVNSYKQAQTNLPTESDMSEADKQLKDDLKASLMQVLTDATAANRASRPLKSTVPKPPDVRPPWERAESVLEKLTHTLNTTSSAWVIFFAHRTFNQGAEFVCEGDPKEWKMLPYPPGALTPAAHSVLEGIMRDPRCFVDKPDLRSRLKDQLVMELEAHNGWDHACPLEQVQLEMRHRVRVKGWDSVKPALRSSVQEWILYAFYTHVVDHQPVEGLESYKRAIAMLDFVRTTWPDVPTSDRGAICENAFLFPLKRLALHAYVDLNHPARFSNEHIAELEAFASALVRDIEAEIPVLTSNLATSERLSYWFYPKDEGKAAMAWVEYSKSKNADNPEEYLRKASGKYIIAVTGLEDDDEYLAHLLSLSVDCMWRSKTPLKTILPVCNRIRSAVPKMRKIWAISQLSATRDARIQQILKYETEQKRSIERGEATLEDIVVPSDWNAERNVELFV